MSLFMQGENPALTRVSAFVINKAAQCVPNVLHNTPE